MVDGAILAQPLYLENVPIAGRPVNIVYVTTTHNMIYAYDADNPSATTPYWSRSLGTFATPSGWNTGMGICGTPVIERSLQAIYIVAATFENGHRVFRLHALDLVSGANKFGSPVVISGQVPGSAPEGLNGLVPFQPDQQVHRAGLAISGNTVYATFSADRDHLPYHGWVIGYDLTTLSRMGIYNSSPNATYIFGPNLAGFASGIWQSGRAPAVDSTGAMYLETGNGDFNGTTEFGNSILRLNSNFQGSLTLADWFTTSDWSTLNRWDLDLGFTGPTLIPGTRLLLAGSKTGIFYLVNPDNLGRIQTSDTQIVQRFLGTAGCESPLDFQVCAQIMGQVFAYAEGTPTLYVWGVHDKIRAYPFSSGRFATTPSSIGSMSAQYPGGVLAHSSHLSTAGTGIVWALTSDVPDAGFYFGPGFLGAGTLRAFDSSNLTNELWNSGLNPSRDSLGYMASFALPLVANGRVYAPTFSGQLAVYGLLNGPVQGDLNGDSAVNCADVAILRAAIGKTSSKPGFDLRADVVRDGVIDVRDLSLVSRQLPPGTVCR